jgi:hypothetical protein
MDVNACVSPPQTCLLLFLKLQTLSNSRALNMRHQAAVRKFFRDIEITTAFLGLDCYFFNVLPDFHPLGITP